MEGVRTEKEVAMVLHVAAGWTKGTISSIASIDNMANAKNAMGPLEEEGWSVLIKVADRRLERPVNVMS